MRNSAKSSLFHAWWVGASLALSTASAVAGPAACDNRNNNTHAKLQECVTVQGVRTHLAAFQAIAAANGGDRFSGSRGYDESVNYVAGKLRAAGYVVAVRPFVYMTSFTLGDSSLRQTAPGAATYVEGVDFQVRRVTLAT